MPDWTIHYGDGGTFTSDDGPPEAAPVDGIQWIVERLPNGNTQHHRDRDFYYWTGDCWTAGFERDFNTWVRNLAPQIKYGVCIANADYERIAAEAINARLG